MWSHALDRKRAEEAASSARGIDEERGQVQKLHLAHFRSGKWYAKVRPGRVPCCEIVHETCRMAEVAATRRRLWRHIVILDPGQWYAEERTAGMAGSDLEA